MLFSIGCVPFEFYLSKDIVSKDIASKDIASKDIANPFETYPLLDDGNRVISYP